VSSCAIDDDECLLLFDLLAVPDGLLALARKREPMIVLTAPWHERDAQALLERLDARLFAPAPDTPQDLIDKYDITAEQVGDGSPDLPWLRSGGGTARVRAPRTRGTARPCCARTRARLTAGIYAMPARTSCCTRPSRRRIGHQPE
jgi:hypothetical protein